MAHLYSVSPALVAQLLEPWRLLPPGLQGQMEQALNAAL